MNSPVAAVALSLLVSGGGEDIYQEVLGGVGRGGINDVILGHW